MKSLFFCCVAWCCVQAALAAGPSAAPAYQLPAADIQAVVDAAPPPQMMGGPQRKTVALLARPSRPALELAAAPALQLAGLSIDTVHLGGAQPAYTDSLTLLSVADGRRQPIRGLPPKSRIAHLEFSPDEQWIALSLWQQQRIALWLVDVRHAHARRLIERPLHAVVGNGFGWMAGSHTLLVSLAPQRPASARPPAVAPLAPAVLETAGAAAVLAAPLPAPAYSAPDADLLDWYLTRQLASVDLAGHITMIGRPERLISALPSPDGQFIMVSRLQRPYAAGLSLLRQPQQTLVWSRQGRPLAVLGESVARVNMTPDRDGVEAGRRDFGWRADAAATVYWSEAADGGDARQQTPFHDGLYELTPPFSQSARLLARVRGRINHVAWGNDALAVLTESWNKDGERRTWRIWPQADGAPPALMFRQKIDERYGDPGRPLLRVLDNGERVLLTSGDGGALFYASAGASDEGDHPMLSRYQLASGESRVLWRSEGPYYEKVLALLDREGQRFLTQRESRDVPPNLFVHEAGQAPRALSDEVSPFPWMQSVAVRELHYQRADGMALSGKLYLPPGYQSERDGPIPVLIWAYPRDFASQSAAAEVRGASHRYAGIDPLSPLVMLLRGYAVLDNPSMPIVAQEGHVANDTYVPQLVASAQAAVDELVRIGVADRARIAIGGHSYGAFMVANLLAHTRLFAAGIAESGAYNRSLTPFGFQFERRTLWQAPAVYQAMSPFNYADQIKAPLLMIHGQADSNPGTTLQQSERLFQALKHMGAVARLVTLPGEEHMYRARESVAHVQWEREHWLARFLPR